MTIDVLVSSRACYYGCFFGLSALYFQYVVSTCGTYVVLGMLCRMLLSLVVKILSLCEFFINYTVPI